MRRAVSVVVIVIMCAVSAAAQSAPKIGSSLLVPRFSTLWKVSEGQTISRKPTGDTAAAPAQEPNPKTPNDSDTDAMRADLAHMRNLVAQMQRNLGFVDSGLTPLKHQFELEIEMWNVLINDMQRRLNAQSGRQASGTKSSPQ